MNDRSLSEPAHKASLPIPSLTLLNVIGRILRLFRPLESLYFLNSVNPMIAAPSTTAPTMIPIRAGLLRPVVVLETLESADVADAVLVGTVLEVNVLVVVEKVVCVVPAVVWTTPERVVGVEFGSTALGEAAADEAGAGS